ncbi:DUF4382 domain-containing protein [Halalkalicoccus ordinarius]|uniref:DUF4382 domain-containing protein n=1 Tax=Halalkalicoccus ordinarius TaxID=3116651 RepID=UPI00300F4558
MERRQYIKATGAAVTGSLLAGCAAGGSKDAADEGDANDDGEESGSGESGTGTLATSVTDQPVDIDDFESCVVTVDGIWVKPANADEEGDENETDDDGSDEDETDENVTDEDEPEEPEVDAYEGHDHGPDDGSDTNETAGDDGENAADDEGDENETAGDDGTGDAPDESGGRYYVEFDEPQEADLVRLQGVNTQLIDETELAVGEYRFLQLNVSGVEGTLADGGEAEVKTPGNAPLQFQHSFEIRADEVTRFIADFAPVRLGRGNRYLIKPVATGTQVLYGDEEYDPEAGDGGGSDGSDGASGTDDGDEGTGGDERAPDDDDGSGN